MKHKKRYKCKENDNIIEMHIGHDEILVCDGLGSCTIIGLKDLFSALAKFNLGRE